jgi:GNAT superfamily N-acetyltransferase
VSSLGAIEKLRSDHNLDGFDCGKEELNRFLKRHAWASQQANSAQTYVVADGSKVAGYYSLAAGSVTHADAPERVTKGLARLPIPVVLLARLAVDKTLHNKGVGSALLKDALLRTSYAADIVGARALLVHAKDDEAKSFYERFDFEASLSDPLHLFLLMKDIRVAIGRQQTPP